MGPEVEIKCTTTEECSLQVVVSILEIVAKKDTIARSDLVGAYSNGRFRVSATIQRSLMYLVGHQLVKAGASSVEMIPVISSMYGENGQRMMILSSWGKVILLGS